MIDPVVIATFNTHAGMDGWGRPFDLVSACAAIDADVLVLQEVWTPENQPSQAHTIADRQGYEMVEMAMATGRRARPHPAADHRWKQDFDWRSQAHALYLDGAIPYTRAVTGSTRYRSAEMGAIGLAVLSRLPITSRSTIDLGRLRRDRMRRGAVMVRLDAGGQELTVVGTHMSHLTYGSIFHFRQLSRQLAGAIGTGAAALVGDMNLWGPPLTRLVPGWHRAVRGPTWPAWRPHSQIDHILVRGPVLFEQGEVLPEAGSDHRAVRTRLSLTGTIALTA